MDEGGGGELTVLLDETELGSDSVVGSELMEDDVAIDRDNSGGADEGVGRGEGGGWGEGGEGEGEGGGGGRGEGLAALPSKRES